GTEIARRGLPGDPGSTIPFDAEAQSHPRGLAEEVDISASISALVPGQNLLAIQAFGSRARDPQFSFLAELLSTVNHGPFIQIVSTNSVQVVWKTPVPTDTRVEYGTSSALDQVFFDPALLTSHSAA